jgi:metal-responsive CopG/Arc/MetJ family transcriptional regulator
MQVIEQKIEIDKTLLAEIEEAAEFVHKTSSEFVNEVLLKSLKRYRRDKEIAQRYKEAYGKFPQELDDSEEEWEHWRKEYQKWEQNNK